MKKQRRAQGPRARPPRQPGRPARSGGAKVADTFLSEGPIVATVGNPSEGREEKVAHADGTEPNYPIARARQRLVSASASEIVAGALKNHDRAVIIGETTLRQGQRAARLHRPARQGGAQADHRAVPHRAGRRLDPGRGRDAGHRARPDDGRRRSRWTSTADTDGIKERDLSRSLSNARASDGGQPLESRTLRPPQQGAPGAIRERGGDPDENFELDFADPVRRATSSRTCSPASASTRSRQAKTFIADTRKRGAREGLGRDLKGVGIDWSDAPADVLAARAPAPPAGRRGEARDRPPEQRGHRGRPDGASSSPSPTRATRRSTASSA